MKEIKDHIVLTYYVALPAKHHGSVEVGKVLTTGQDELEKFTIEQEYLDRLAELDINTNDTNYFPTDAN